MAEDLNYEQFVQQILNQLYANRAKHRDHRNHGIDYMLKIGYEQLGQMSGALAERDYDKAYIEVGHTCAIMFELFIRIKEKCGDGTAAPENNVGL